MAKFASRRGNSLRFRLRFKKVLLAIAVAIPWCTQNSTVEVLKEALQLLLPLLCVPRTVGAWSWHFKAAPWGDAHKRHAFRKGTLKDCLVCLQRKTSMKALSLGPERPFTGVSGPSGPKIAKKSQKASFGGPQKSPPKYPKKQKNAKSPILGIF